MTYKTIDSSETIRQIKTTLDQLEVDYLVKGARLAGTKEHITFTLELPMYVNGDLIHPQIILVNSYNKECAFRLSIGLYRFVCSNGLMVGDTLFSERIIHVEGHTATQKLSGLSDGIRRAVAYIKEEMQDDLDGMTSVELTEEAMISVIDSLNIQLKAKEQCIAKAVFPMWRRGAERTSPTQYGRYGTW